jgi:hypothetical protein
MQLKYYNFFFIIFLLAKNIFSQKEIVTIFIHGIIPEWSCKAKALKYFFTPSYKRGLTSSKNTAPFTKKGLLGMYGFLSERLYNKNNIHKEYQFFLPQDAQNKNNSENNYFFIWGKNQVSPGTGSRAGYKEAADALLEYIEEYCAENKLKFVFLSRINATALICSLTSSHLTSL